MISVKKTNGLGAVLKYRVAGLYLLLAMALVACADRPALQRHNEACVVIDNDYDIDDMMAMPMVVANKQVAAIVQSEGYSLPEVSAPALERLINGSAASPSDRAIPVIVGSRASESVDLSRWPWLGFFRDMMAHSNGLLSSKPAPRQSQPDYPAQVAQAVSHCQSVSVLILGTYSSFVNYSPRIRHQIDKVVIMGKPMGQQATRHDKQSFNCAYDWPACRQAMGQLQGLKSFFVDIPRIEGCRGPAPPVASCYGPTLEMVQGLEGRGGLREQGLPGRLRQALINAFDCNGFFLSGMPVVQGTACTSQSTWVPTEVMAGPGGQMLFWDQTAALFLLYPDLFALNVQSAVDDKPGHFEPSLFNASHVQTIERMRTLWTDSTNRGQ
ncbi:MAG: hypothetical protein AAB176_12975 [Pseudomonadota bacterium]|jgi:hypothetical protein